MKVEGGIPQPLHKEGGKICTDLLGTNKFQQQDLRCSCVRCAGTWDKRGDHSNAAVIPSATFPLVRTFAPLELFKFLKTPPEGLASRTEGTSSSDHTSELSNKQAKV